MRMPRVRFTVRRMMVAVAAIGLAIGVYAAGRERAERFRERGGRHWTHYVGIMLGGESATDRELTEPERRRLAARMGWHKAMSEKYDRAARYPWFPVALDSPEPE